MDTRLEHGTIMTATDDGSDGGAGAETFTEKELADTETWLQGRGLTLPKDDATHDAHLRVHAGLYRREKQHEEQKSTRTSAASGSAPDDPSSLPKRYEEMTLRSGVQCSHPFGLTMWVGDEHQPIHIRVFSTQEQTGVSDDPDNEYPRSLILTNKPSLHEALRRMAYASQQKEDAPVDVRPGDVTHAFEDVLSKLETGTQTCERWKASDRFSALLDSESIVDKEVLRGSLSDIGTRVCELLGDDLDGWVEGRIHPNKNGTDSRLHFLLLRFDDDHGIFGRERLAEYIERPSTRGQSSVPAKLEDWELFAVTEAAMDSSAGKRPQV